jgi:putative ABC transport system permease protein
MTGLLQNVRYGLRQMRGNRGFTLAVVATLALAIGANTAAFSIMSSLILSSLPYPHPERMGTIYTRIAGSKISDERHGLNGEQWELLRDDVPALVSAVSSRGTSGVNLQAGSHVEYVHEGRVSAHYFDVLDLQPFMGRNFTEDEDRPHSPKAAILSYSLWRNTLGSNPNILGSAVQLKGEPYIVVGVLPEDAVTPLGADIYTTLQPGRNGEGAGTNFASITRLRSGATWQEADAEINRAWLQRSGRYELNENPGAQVIYHSVSLQRGQTDSLRPQLLALMLATGFILLIACANLAGLTLVRVQRRTSEVATRLALGASYWQIQKQFWVENLLLALAGGVIGIGVGFITLRGLLLLLPEHFFPVAHIDLNGRVLAFTLLVSLLTSVLFGMLPALAARRVTIRSSVAGRSGMKAGSLHLRRALIAGEVALTIVLLVSSGLLVRSLAHLETLPPGFNPNGVIAAKASLDEAVFHEPAAFRKLMDESTAAMRQIPGVQDAAVGLSLPYERVLNNQVTLREGEAAGQQVQTDVSYVTPGYFETLQLPVLAGRGFTSADGPNTEHVAVVNQAFARKFYGGANPVGRYLDKDTRIVGEVADVYVVSGLYSDAPLMSDQQMYIPAAQMNGPSLALVHGWFQPNWIVRTVHPVEGLTGQMQHALAGVNPNLPFSGFYSMQDLLTKTLAMQRVEVALLGAMAALALLLSAVGIFALVAHLVAQRTGEIGVRMALGAQPASVVRLVVGEGARPVLAGLVMGTAGAALLSRFMSSALFGISTTDPITFLCVGVVLLFVALAASYIPARRAAKVDPMVALRYE